ncbi:MAG: hypothetical protein RL026_1746 [Pseudomonadota bacterium]
MSLPGLRSDAGQGRAFLLLHGWALDGAQWTPQCAALATQGRVVCLDRPGFGEAPGRAGVDADEAAIGAAIDALQLGPVVLVASSQAARGALRFALRQPARLAGLVLDGAPLEGFLPPPWPADAAPVDRLAELLAREGLQAVRQALAALPFFHLQRPAAAESALLATMLGRYSARDLTQPGPVTALPMPERLAQLAVPTLVINGEHDSPHRRLVGDALAYGLPQAQRLLLRGAGHLPNLDQPAAYAAALLAFAAGLPAHTENPA